MIKKIGKRAFHNTLEKIMEHNDYNGALTVTECNASNNWSPCDLILREYYNNGGGSAKGFLGIEPSRCITCYYYIKEHQEELIANDMISKDGYNNWGYPLWKDYKIY